MIITKHNKIVLEPKEIDFIKANHGKMTNRELADALGLKLTKLRTFCYQLGLYHMRLQYWTEQQIQFLKDHYQELGDTELAEIFEVKWKKEKGWSKKHIEKKRRYLKLKRTKAEIQRIHQRNVFMGRFKICPIKAWQTRGVAEIGEKRIWFRKDNTPFIVIKTKTGFVHYNRWLWEQEKGKIPKGYNVCIKPGSDRINYTINDLHLLSNDQLSKQNSNNRLPKELKETAQLIRKINKQFIKQTTK